MKETYGSDAEEEESEEDSEDAESEDEDGEQLTPAMDAAILRTLAKIKRKDPEIYDKDKSIIERTLSLTSRLICGLTILRGTRAGCTNDAPL